MKKQLKVGDEKAFSPTVVYNNHEVPAGWPVEDTTINEGDKLIFFGNWDYEEDGWVDQVSADYLLVDLLPEGFQLESGSIVLCELIARFQPDNPHPEVFIWKLATQST